MRFLHISDLHLGKTFPVSRYGQQFAHRRRQELLDTFSRLIDFANQNQVDFILCCGDFLNSEELRVEELRNINAKMCIRDSHAIVASMPTGLFGILRKERRKTNGTDIKS